MSNSKKKPILLGHKVKDIATGIVGNVTGMVELMNGNVQYSVQPLGDGTKIEDAHYIDYHTLDYVDDGIVSRASPADATCKIKLGDKVRHTITGLEGVATEKITFLNGCVYFVVTPKAEKPHEMPKGQSLQHGALEVITPAAPAPAPAPAVKPAKKAPGGPMRAAYSQR